MYRVQKFAIQLVESEIKITNKKKKRYTKMTNKNATQYPISIPFRILHGFY